MITSLFLFIRSTVVSWQSKLVTLIAKDSISSIVVRCDVGTQKRVMSCLSLHVDGSVVMKSVHVEYGHFETV